MMTDIDTTITLKPRSQKDREFYRRIAETGGVFIQGSKRKKHTLRPLKLLDDGSLLCERADADAPPPLPPAYHVGDIVRLASGGHDMTVIAVHRQNTDDIPFQNDNHDRICVAWSRNGKIKTWHNRPAPLFVVWNGNLLV